MRAAAGHFSPGYCAGTDLHGAIDLGSLLVAGLFPIPNAPGGSWRHMREVPRPPGRRSGQEGLRDSSIDPRAGDRQHLSDTENGGRARRRPPRGSRPRVVGLLHLRPLLPGALAQDRRATPQPAGGQASRGTPAGDGDDPSPDPFPRPHDSSRGNPTPVSDEAREISCGKPVLAPIHRGLYRRGGQVAHLSLAIGDGDRRTRKRTNPR